MNPLLARGKIFLWTSQRLANNPDSPVHSKFCQPAVAQNTVDKYAEIFVRLTGRQPEI